MNKRDFMIEKRKVQGCTLSEMAKRVDCSWVLLDALEFGDFPCTHPQIAARIAQEYGLSVDEYNQIVHESHRVTKLPKPAKKPKSNGLYDAWRCGWGKEEGVQIE